jgi:hypothetical protein
MSQLGILTKGQKKKPVIPDVSTNAEGKPNPGDVEKAKAAASLGDKAEARKAAMLKTGGANIVPEADPMKKSQAPR